MTDGMKFFIGILLIVAVAGISFIGVSKANSTQKEKTEAIEAVNDEIWNQIGN